MAELSVSKKSIGKLFAEMQNRKFIIPDFQRPYKWDFEKCETLWKDIEDFSTSDAKTGSDYFLGTIVSYKNDDNNLEIIDGQQRITSFFLLLRAFYRKLELMTEDEDVIGLKNQVAPCLWDINPISQKVTDLSKIHIESLVATELDNDIFHNILQYGRHNEESQDNYSLNYKFFKKQCDEYAEANPMQWKQLCITILQKCIILPIECDTPETALTIFSTLNDRGMPLADSDIFKARIYKNYLIDDDRKKFTNLWKDLTEICKNAKISIDDVFRYYSHVLRSRNNDKSKEIGLRRFYTEDDYGKLKQPELMDEIISLANFWQFMNLKNESIEDEPDNSFEARKYLHCLNQYPNDFWKYAVSVFFLKNIKLENFNLEFGLILKKLTAFLFSKFIESPTVNAIKDDIYQICISIQNNQKFSLRSQYDEQSISDKLDSHYSSRISRALLLLDAYLDDDQISLIPDTFEVEHIFPKKWQDTNYNGWDNDDALKFLDRFGNKIVFEKKLNIQAGNGYFGKKKQEYQKSKIASIIKLSKYHKNDWVKEDIIDRELRFKSNVLSFFSEQLGIN